MSAFCHECLPLLNQLGECVRKTVSASLKHSTASQRSQPTGHAGSDVIYTIDREVEEKLVDLLEQEAEGLGGLVLIAEGIGEDEKTIYPATFSESNCAWRMLMDPIDGTRGIMMDKRSAWFIACVAKNNGDDTRLRESECAILAELPNSRAGFADVLTAVKGKGVNAIRKSNLNSGTCQTLEYTPYSGKSIRGGFAQFVRFFPGGRELIAELEERLWQTLFPDASDKEILGFEDQYISTGGQWVELISGRDRFCADLRATLFHAQAYANRRKGHTCHPYDMAGWLIAEEAGILLTDPGGNPLDAPFDTRTECDWVGYANQHIKAEVEPVLQKIISPLFDPGAVSL